MFMHLNTHHCHHVSIEMSIHFKPRWQPASKVSTCQHCKKYEWNEFSCPSKESSHWASQRVRRPSSSRPPENHASRHASLWYVFAIIAMSIYWQSHAPCIIHAVWQTMNQKHPQRFELEVASWRCLKQNVNIKLQKEFSVAEEFQYEPLWAHISSTFESRRQGTKAQEPYMAEFPQDPWQRTSRYKCCWNRSQWSSPEETPKLKKQISVFCSLGLVELAIIQFLQGIRQRLGAVALGGRMLSWMLMRFAFYWCKLMLRLSSLEWMRMFSSFKSRWIIWCRCMCSTPSASCLKTCFACRSFAQHVCNLTKKKK